MLGGCGYDVFSSAPDSAARTFFDHLLDAGRDAFDLFDAHLYGDPYRLPDYLDTARSMMRAHGYEKPIVAGEYAGPSFFEFPPAETAIYQALASAFTAPAALDTEALKQQVGQDTPERRAMLALYARMPDLPPRLQMFMAGCPPELDDRRHRIACRQIVVRNLLALSAGIRRTLYWNLAPEVPAAVDPYMMMHLLVGKLPLLDYRGDTLGHQHPAAQTFRLLAAMLSGVVDLRRVEAEGQPTVYAFQARRRHRGEVLVVWERRDTFEGECAPPIRVALKWQEPAAHAIDAFGRTQPADIGGGAVHLEVTDTPVFVTGGA